VYFLTIRSYFPQSSPRRSKGGFLVTNDELIFPRSFIEAQRFVEGLTHESVDRATARVPSVFTVTVQSHVLEVVIVHFETGQEALLLGKLESLGALENFVRAPYVVRSYEGLVFAGRWEFELLFILPGLASLLWVTKGANHEFGLFREGTKDK